MWVRSRIQVAEMRFMRDMKLEDPRRVDALNRWIPEERVKTATPDKGEESSTMEVPQQDKDSDAGVVSLKR